MSYLRVPNISLAPTTLPPHPFSFPLDPFQQHAISAIANNENVLVCAKTGSGKTLVGEYQIYHSLSKGKRVFYTTPIKSLSNQKFYDLKHQFKDTTVGIMTGDIKFCPDAQIVIMTTEILRNLLYKKGTTTEHLGLTASISLDNLDAVVFDECHYINDKDRGKVWEETMILLPPEVNLVMLSATLNRPEIFAEWLGQLKQKPIHLIQTQYRIVPLTHNVLDNNYKLVPFMDAKETYNEKVYIDWCRAAKAEQDDKKAFQRKVKDARLQGVEGAIDGKVHRVSFVHKMNETIRMLEKENLLPALYFVLSRKQCEAYAAKVETTLLDSSDTAAVKHIIKFHLHPYMEQLEKVPQYYQIHDLLCKGIAFHHSGLLPILKEIIEILFTKGYVKLLFCTETFAVGLNMPTKTVLFAGLKKFDDQTGGMRLLRMDEYIQMAGRAGRRGKDTFGTVIYLPDQEPVEPFELKSIIKGDRPPIQSRMDFGYDFILKTLQSSPKDSDESLRWLEIMEKSYWFRQRQLEIKSTSEQIKHFEDELSKIQTGDIFWNTFEEISEYELEMKRCITDKTKVQNLKKCIDILKSKQIGPKWIQAGQNYKNYAIIKKQIKDSNSYIEALQRHQISIEDAAKFLKLAEFITEDNPLKLRNSSLTLRGILATEINEGHQLIMPELYLQGHASSLTGEELVAVLACFMEEKSNEETPSLSELDIPVHIRNTIKQLKSISEKFITLDNSCGCTADNAYWNISLQMVEPLYKWAQGENASKICQDYGLFEGNFIRCVMKMSNMLDEWLAMATYCQHTDQIDKITEIRGKMIRDVAVSDSLYLKL